MSTGDSKLNFRLSPTSNKATKSFDHLNANNGSRTINPAANAITDDDSGDVRQTNGKNVNEFPFGDISFRFDELKNCQSNQTPISNNSGNSARMDSDDFNYKMVRSNGNHHRNIEYGNMGNGNGAELHHRNRNNEVYTTSSNQMPAAIAAMNNAIAQLSAPAAHHEYENVDGNDETDTNTYRSMTGKPVHSDAKSTFLGLKNANGSNKSDAKSIVSVETPPRQSYDDSDNVTSADVEEFEPLLDALESNKMTSASTRTPASVQYQNVPNNSVCFVANAAKVRAIECNECGKICCDEVNGSGGGGSKWENERDQYCRCNGINSSPTSTTGGTMSSAGIESPTCSTSMKSAKPITLDNSTSFRMSQSLSQVRSLCYSSFLFCVRLVKAVHVT